MPVNVSSISVPEPDLAEPNLVTWYCFEHKRTRKACDSWVPTSTSCSAILKAREYVYFGNITWPHLLWPSRKPGRLRVRMSTWLLLSWLFESVETRFSGLEGSQASLLTFPGNLALTTECWRRVCWVSLPGRLFHIAAHSKVKVRTSSSALAFPSLSVTAPPTR